MVVVCKMLRCKIYLVLATLINSHAGGGQDEQADHN